MPSCGPGHVIRLRRPRPPSAAGRGWHLSTSQSAASVAKRTALARPFLSVRRTDRQSFPEVGQIRRQGRIVPGRLRPA